MHDRPSAAKRHARDIAAAMAVSLVVLVVEISAALASNSVALLADAAHVFADVSGFALSLFAIRMAARPRTDERTFGLYRLEILAATANALLLLALATIVIVEGLRRLAAPPDVDTPLVAVVASVALLANVVSLRLVMGGRDESLTVRGAYLEVLGDLLGAGAVLLSAVVTATTGWLAADAVASVFIGILIVPRTLSLLRDSVDVLLEASPKGIDVAEVRRHILEAPGVEEVHDLHAWTLTSGMNVVSAHVVLGDDAIPGAVLDHLALCLSGDFDIQHSTFQIENAEHVRWEARALP
jgi:cobalt-zinc-cadmium efflux system protein